jgi:hypothetical protein
MIEALADSVVARLMTIPGEQSPRSRSGCGPGFGVGDADRPVVYAGRNPQVRSSQPSLDHVEPRAYKREKLP